MTRLTPLLEALVAADASALVIDAGQPYLVGADGMVEVPGDPLTGDGVTELLAELLSPTARRTFEQLGAVQAAVSPLPEFPNRHFTVNAVKMGNALWVEVQRGTGPPSALQDTDRREPTTEAPGPAPPAVPPPPPEPVHPEEPQRVESAPLPSTSLDDDEFEWLDEPGVPTRQSPLPQAAPMWRGSGGDSASPIAGSSPRPSGVDLPSTHGNEPSAPPPTVVASPTSTATTTTQVASVHTKAYLRRADPQDDDLTLPPPEELWPGETFERVAPVPVSVAAAQRFEPVAGIEAHDVAPPFEVFEETTLAAGSDLARLLNLAVERGASTLFLTADSAPAIRVRGEIQVLGHERSLSAADIETIVLSVMPRVAQGSFKSQSRVEWTTEVPGIGRTRCLGFRDLRGPCATFRIPSRPLTVDQLGLSPDAQRLALEGSGVVLVGGTRADKRAVIASLVDLVNRSRRDRVITLEPDIDVVHDPQCSLISQREIRGGAEEWATAVRLALGEDPDVLVIEELRGDETARSTLDAAGAGRLVIVGTARRTTVEAIESFIHMFRADEQAAASVAFAETLRGVVAHAAVSSTDRAFDREVLINTREVAALIAGGRFAELAPLQSPKDAPSR